MDVLRNAFADELEARAKKIRVGEICDWREVRTVAAEKVFREIWDKALDDTWGKPEFASLMIDQKAVKMFDEAVITAFHAYTRSFQVNRNDVLEEAAAVADKKEKDATTLQGWNVHTVGIKDGAELAAKMIAEQIRELKG